MASSPAKLAYNKARYWNDRENRLAGMRTSYHKLTTEEKRARSERNRFKSKYGITSEDYERMLLEQNYTCAICPTQDFENKNGILFVDHDHATGAVRGLLCDPCNRMIGCGRDNPDRLRSGAKYLEGAKCPG